MGPRWVYTVRRESQLTRAHGVAATAAFTCVIVCVSAHLHMASDEWVIHAHTHIRTTVQLEVQLCSLKVCWKNSTNILVRIRKEEE